MAKKIATVEEVEQTARLLDKAEPFCAQRRPRWRISLRLDSSDLSLARRIARGQGILYEGSTIGGCEGRLYQGLEPWERSFRSTLPIS